MIGTLVVSQMIGVGCCAWCYHMRAAQTVSILDIIVGGCSERGTVSDAG